MNISPSINNSSSANPTNELLNLKEVVELAGVDGVFFEETFFPKTFRMKSPPFATDVWNLLDSHERMVSLQLFRGSGKTSRCRVFAAKKVAYAQARTILWICKSQDKAVHSVKWLRKQIEFNSFYRDTFKLSPGSKWQDVECEIWHGIEETPITIIAYGITGPIRGVNIDDYRPDLILLDDIVDEEVAASPLQRQKIEELVYGAIKQSLAPATEAPHAKMVMLQTPIDQEDISMKSLMDPEWKTLRVPCWTKETENLPLLERESCWEIRFPTETLVKEKEAAISRNQSSIFTREMECRIISRETSAFLTEWIRFYDLDPEDFNQTVMVIDPVPPPSEKELKKGLKDKDYECLTVITRAGSNFYLRDYSMKHGHDPDWTITEFFRLARKYRPQNILVESVAYQRTLAWLLRKAMEHRREYFVVNEITDKRSKYQRIIDGLTGVASNRKLFIKREHTEFYQQYSAYPNVSHDDVIETVAVGLASLQGPHMYSSDEDIELEELQREERDLPKLFSYNGAP